MTFFIRTKIKYTIEDFSRLQTYMLETEKNTKAYSLMKTRYLELKAILSTSGVNITELDVIKE